MYKRNFFLVRVLSFETPSRRREFSREVKAKYIDGRVTPGICQACVRRCEHCSYYYAPYIDYAPDRGRVDCHV